MDPYLEAPDIWPDFHERLASVMSEMLNAQLPEPYYSRLQMRPEMGEIFIEVRVRTDPLHHQFVEIRDAARNHKLITLIEIVSPSNKRPGPDRRAYESKQRDVLDSDANLIEIDLLRGGRRLLPYPDLEGAVHQLACHYLILLYRYQQRLGNWMDYTLFPMNLRDTLPCLPVPLTGDDPDIPLDLQIAMQEIYQRALYSRMIDYTLPPDPPLADEDMVWIDIQLHAADLRGPVWEPDD
jgi:hypothetical protein